MIVRMKDALKLIIISVMACCAVFVSTMFLNFNLDLASIKSQVTPGDAAALYDALKMAGIVVSASSGGCLLITTVIMLTFYIRHYIDTHKKELGILKAIGYSNMKIAKSFWVFGLSILAGSAVGFAGSFLIMPVFYKVQNDNDLLPDIAIGFHPLLLILLVIVPAILFALISIGYAVLKLKTPVLALIRDSMRITKYKKIKESKKELSFTDDLKKNTLKSRKALVFFIIFASFCFSAMTQMSFGVNDMTSRLMGAILMVIGLVLALVTLFLAVTTVVNGSTKTIAMMRVFGYSHKDCCRAILDGYRPMSYIGFAIGTVYQYILLKLSVKLVFKNMENIPDYHFDVPVMLVSLAVFILMYESFMRLCQYRIRKVSVKEIMMES